MQIEDNLQVDDVKDPCKATGLWIFLDTPLTFVLHSLWSQYDVETVHLK